MSRMRKLQIGIQCFIALVSLLFIGFFSTVLAGDHGGHNDTIISSPGRINEQCKAKVLPSFINNSMYWGDGFGEVAGRSIYRSFRSLSPPSIVVTAAGNLHPTPVPPYKAKASKDFDAIIVGSLDPQSRRSSFSQQGEEVHIMAPSDRFLTSADGAGNYRLFGGTSGATPLVTGSLAGFEWLSGYHPTPKEAKILLEKTAIPTRYPKESPRRNGVGMVNAYKLGMVGKRLKSICGQNQSCFKSVIQKPSLYSFPEDPGLPQVVNQAFPECNRSKACFGESNGSCKESGAVFKRLRKAVLLNPSNSKLWRYLACIYKSSGFLENARGTIEFYKNSVFPDGVAYCKKDADCTLIPDCSSRNPNDFLAVTKTEAEVFYISEPDCKNETATCNGKCRCGSEETVNNSSTGGRTEIDDEINGSRSVDDGIETGGSLTAGQVRSSITYSSRCVNFRCALQRTEAVSETEITGSEPEIMAPIHDIKEPSSESRGSE